MKSVPALKRKVEQTGKRKDDDGADDPSKPRERHKFSFLLLWHPSVKETLHCVAFFGLFKWGVKSYS